jgi:hypothetical protein
MDRQRRSHENRQLPDKRTNKIGNLRGLAEKTDKDAHMIAKRTNGQQIEIHCKKRFAILPSPAGMSLTKLSLDGNNLIISVQGEFGK